LYRFWLHQDNKMKNRGFKIILVSDSESEIRQLNINRKLLYGLPVLLVVGIAFILYLFSNFYSNKIYTQKLEQVKADNSKLVESILETEERANLLQDQLDNIKKRDDLIREMVKLPKIDDDIRKVGVGGNKASDDESSLEYLLPDHFKGLHSLKKNFDFLNRLANLEQLSYEEIYNRVTSDLERFQSFPAVHPIPLDNCHLTSGFGMRVDPIDRKNRFHEGNDFASRWGTPVRATADGIVKSSKYYGTFGNYIEIDHGHGLKTIYGHMSKRKVKRGDKVTRGQIIGAVGNTGKSTASHLHYGVKYKRKDVDPSDYFYDLTIE